MRSVRNVLNILSDSYTDPGLKSINRRAIRKINPTAVPIPNAPPVTKDPT